MLVRSRSARTLRSMAELVSVAVERRARVHASGWAAGVGGRAPYSTRPAAGRPFERGAPGNAVGGKRRPLSRADVEHGERLGHRAAVRHARCAARPRVRHPAGEHASRQPREVHARHVGWPSQPSCRRAT